MPSSSLNTYLKRCLLALLLLAAAALYGAAPLFFPAVRKADTPAEFFSAERAMQHIAQIGRQPHPAGSAALAEVAAYIQSELEKAGLEAEIQSSTGMWAKNTFELRNVVARLPGDQPGQGVLLLAHPDSTPFGPGAGDNATGAAALLELARALKAGPSLQNDVYFLFDDGEELGYLGGYAFTREHPWMRGVSLAIGLDTAAWGPAVLLQTTPNNGHLVTAYAQSVRRPQAAPLAFGFFADADWNISHDDSEIQPFVEKGITGLAIEDPTAFPGKHSPSDTLERVRPGSIQQMGDQTLALVRQLAGQDLEPRGQPDRSYFTLWGLGVVHYPAQANDFLFAGAAVLLAVTAVSGVRKQIFTTRGLGLSFLVGLGGFLLAVVVGLAVSTLFDVIFPPPHPYVDSYLLPASLPMWLAAIVLALFLAGFLRRKAVRRWGPSAVGLAGLGLWALLYGGFKLLNLQVGSYIVALPLALAAFAWGCRLLPRTQWQGLLSRVLLFVPALVAAALLSPNLILAYLGSGLETLPLVTSFSVLALELAWAAVV